MLHNEETTLLQQEVHLERNTQRTLCSTVSNDGTLVSLFSNHDVKSLMTRPNAILFRQEFAVFVAF